MFVLGGRTVLVKKKITQVDQEPLWQNFQATTKKNKYQVSALAASFFLGGSQKEKNAIWDHTFMTSTRNGGGRS